MSCQRCNSSRIASVTGKCNDCCGFSVGSKNGAGYVPGDMGVGEGDYLEVEYCLDCGQLQGDFPLPLTEVEEQ